METARVPTPESTSLCQSTSWKAFFSRSWRANAGGELTEERHGALADEVSTPVAAARLRVLMLTTYPSYGGPLPKIAPLLVEGLHRAGCEVHVLGWSAHSAGPEPILSKICGRSADLARVLHRVRRWRPQVVYVATSHSWPTLLRDMPLALAVTRCGPPLVLHLHGSGCDRLGKPGQGLFTVCSTWLARRAAAVMLLSREELEPWHRLCPETRFEVVLNPFVPALPSDPVGSTHVPSKHPPSLLIVARLIREKGLFDLVEALDMVRRHRPCRLVIAGTGPADDALARRVGHLGISDLVDLRGYLTGPQLDEAYRGADIFVLPSYHKEGFPLSVMEAMGYGLPVITTRIRGCADFLVPEEHALFVPSKNPRMLAEVIERLLDDSELRDRMGRNNLRKVGDFAPEVVVPRYAQVLRSVAESDWSTRLPGVMDQD